MWQTFQHRLTAQVHGTKAAPARISAPRNERIRPRIDVDHGVAANLYNHEKYHMRPEIAAKASIRTEHERNR